MAEVDDRDVVPDTILLEHIFGNNQPSSVSHECVVRLEVQDATSALSFALVAAMQEIARICIPQVVPETLQVGSAVNKEGREFQYSVVEFVEGATLEEAWEHMMDEDRKSVTAFVVEALLKLQSVRLPDSKVQTILRRALGEGGAEVLLKSALGGPSAGFLEDGRSLLSSVEQEWKLKRPFLTIQPAADQKGLLVKSSFEDIGSTTVTDLDMEQWPKEAVFRRNDLTPRNLILQHSHSETLGGHTRYKLAAIIDWELAGFYPPSSQLFLQDTYLSGNNRHLSFYMLLKDAMKDMVPRSRSQMALLRAMEIIFESRQRDPYEGTNILAHIRRRFIEFLPLSWDEDPYVGWRCQGTSLPDVSRDDFQKLEDEVIEDMIRRRQVKAKAT